MTPRSLIEPARHAGTALLRSQTDARLVDLTRDGNERAFEAIVQRYRRPLLRYCTRLLSPARAEDAVQQAFLSAHRAIHAGDAELNLRPWLYRIAHNASLNLLRQHGFDHDEVSEEIDGVETPPQAFERGERLRMVVAAVRELPPRQRDAIVLQAVEGRSYEEIAAELGVSDGAVRQLLNRARNTLREAAAALTPSGLLTRLAASGGDGSVAERIAATIGGAGGGAVLAKAGAALVVAGAIAGGLPGPEGGGARHAAGPAAASAGGSSSPGTRRAHAIALGHGPAAERSTQAGPISLRTGHSGRRGTHHGRGHSVNAFVDQSGPGGASGSGRGGGRRGDGGSSHSGSGDSGSGGSDHSGSGSGSGDSGSGSGSGDSGSGSGSSGSGDSGSGGSDHSGSGSDSGSGSGSGSGTDDSTSTTPTTTTTTTSTDSSDRSGSGSDSGSGDGTSGGSDGHSGSLNDH